MRIAIIVVGNDDSNVTPILHQLITKLSEVSQSDGYNQNPIEIVIIEKQNEIGPGLAYSTNDKSHILNLPAKVMSPIPEEPEHFYNWAVQNKSKWQADFPEVNIEECQYPPRALYGIYLKSLLSDLIEKARQKNIIVKPIVNRETTDVVKEQNGQFKIIFSDATLPPLVCDKVILSVGHLDSDNYCDFKDKKNYFHSPWPAESLRKIPPDATILIAGTGLTAIDVVLSLKKNGHTGKIILGSKLGLLPCVIGKVDSSFNTKFLTYEKILELTGYWLLKLELNQIIVLFKAEIEAGAHKKFDLEKIIAPTISAHDLLKKEVNAVSAGRSRHWQNILFYLYSNISVIWNALSNKSKKLFFEKYYNVWMTHFAAFPLENAEKILALLDNGELEVRGGLKDVTHDAQSGKFNVVFKDQTLQGDYFINATGAGHNVLKTHSPLIQNMLRSSLLVPYNLGGVYVDFKSLQPISAGTVITGLFVTGDSGTYGTCMATDDLGQSSKQASRIAGTIENQLKDELTHKKSPPRKKHYTTTQYMNGIRRVHSENDLNIYIPTNPFSFQLTKHN